MRSLGLAVLGSVLTFCAARPAPDGTAAAAPATTTPAYIDTVQSIECVGSDRIRLSFDNQYSFMDAWDWGLPRAVLINGDVDSVSCDDYKPLGAAWLTSNTADPSLFQQCESGGQCTVEFNVVKADGTFKDLLVSYLSAQNLQVATTSVALDTPTPTYVNAQPSAPQYTVDPWQAKQWSDIADELTNELNNGNPGLGEELLPTGGGGYQRWQEIANEYEKQVQEMPDVNDASTALKSEGENALQETASDTAKDLLETNLKANAEAFAGYFVTTFIAAGLRALLLRAAETQVGKTLVQQFVKMGVRELAGPLLGGLVETGAVAGGGEIVGAGVAATIPVAGEIIGAAIIIFNEIEEIIDLTKTPEMNQDYQVGEFQLTGPNGKQYWVVEKGSAGAPDPYVAPDLPKQFKDPFFFVPPQMVFDPTNVGDDGALKNDPWPKNGWKSYDPMVTVASQSPIGTLAPDDGEPSISIKQTITAQESADVNQPSVKTAEPSQQESQDQSEPQTTKQSTTTEQPSSAPPSSVVSSPSSSSQPKCLVPTAVSNFLTDLSKVFPAYAYAKTFKVNEGQSNEVSFKCTLACANCSLEMNHQTVFQSLFGSGKVDGTVDLNIGLELACTAGENWKDAFKKKASQPLIWGMPAYKKYKKVWQGSGPYCSDFALGAAMGLTFVPFKGKVNFGFSAHRTVSMPIAAQGDNSPQDVSSFHSDWTITPNPVKFSGFGLPSLALGMDLTADWGWELSNDAPLLDAGFDLYPNFTMQFATRSFSADFSDDEVKECELPFQATAGEKPFLYLSVLGKDVWDTVLTPFVETWATTATAGCFANYDSTPATTTADIPTTSAITPTVVPYSRGSNSTFATVTRTSSSSSSSTATAQDITAYPWPDPTFVISTDEFKQLEISTDVTGTSYAASYLSKFLTTSAPSSVTADLTTTSQPAVTSAPSVTPASSASISSVSSTSSSLSALPSVTGIFNTDASCGYAQGACSDDYHCLKVWPVEVAQSYMCGKPDLTNFEAVNIPTDYSPPANNGIWACDANALCYPTCGYLGALFDPTQWTCANPIDNAIWQCLNDDGTVMASTAAANSATQCKMVCQPGFGMNDNGECIDILTDSKNCGQVGFDCSYGYDGYYAATPACAMGMCVDLCPSGYTPFVNLCLNFLTDTFNCGSFGNQCNVANQEVCKNGGCVQCYECYGSM